MKIFKQKILILSLTILLVVPTVVFPANLFFDNEKDVFGINEEFQVDFFIDSESEIINAIEGQIIFPEDVLKISEIRSGNSSINFWVEKPELSSEGVVSFSGITPGGFLGNKQFLFSIIFKTRTEGSGVIGSTKIKVLKNDGNGTEVKAENKPFSFKVNNISVGANGFKIVEDTFPPEDFKPSIGKDPSMFAGKYFVVFATQDKQSGIKQYEVKEGILGDYKVVKSPYLLHDQSLSSFVYVKAIDNSGKEKIVKLFPQNKSMLTKYLIISIIILLLCGFIFKKIWRRPTQQ